MLVLMELRGLGRAISVGEWMGLGDGLGVGSKKEQMVG